MPTFRVTATRKLVADLGYERLLDMFEAECHMAPIDDDKGSRVYLVDAPSSSAAHTALSLMMDRAHLLIVRSHSGFHAEPA